MRSELPGTESQDEALYCLNLCRVSSETSIDFGNFLLVVQKILKYRNK